MIQFSFSPNWYRSQSLSFTRSSHQLFYASNSILYRYDLTTKNIISELNLKQFLLKNQGYSFPFETNKTHRTQRSSNKSQSQKQSLDKKSQNQKQKNLKISAIKLIQMSSSAWVVLGFNCIGILLVVKVDEDQQVMNVAQVIDISKLNSSFCQTEFIYLRQPKVQMIKNQTKVIQSKSVEVMVFSANLVQAFIKITEDDTKEANSRYKIETIVSDAADINIEFKDKNKIKNQQIKLISSEEFVKRNANTQRMSDSSKKQTSQTSQTQKKQHCHLMILSPGIRNEKKALTQNRQLLILDDQLTNVLISISLQNLINMTETNLKFSRLPKESSAIKETENKFSSIRQAHHLILSCDFISQNLQNQTITKYIILTKNTSDKPNLFCERFNLISFDSKFLQCLIQNQNGVASESFHGPMKFSVEIVYPKKCHHKLSQNHKSTLSIKFIDTWTLIITGKLGQIFILNLKQILSKLLNRQNTFTLNLRPYSYEQEPNNLWFLEPNQKHYKDIFAIYRRQNNSLNAYQAIKQKPVPNSHPIKTDIDGSIHMIGTDHILTSWKINEKKSLKEERVSLDKKLAFEYSVKYLTSAVEQIVTCEAEDSLVFLRLKDSNIRSFEPFSGKSYWLNEFWKHTSNSFSKQISKIVMHPTQIGLACMVSSQNKVIFYDLYEQRLVKLIQIRQKIKPKEQESLKQTQKERKQYEWKNKDKGKDHTPQKNNTNTNMRLIQINSISFQHVSIMQALESIYQSEENSDNIFTQEAIKQGFDLGFQTFYEKQIDHNMILLIQSNEYVFVINNLSQKHSPERLKVFRKLFKLERIYKTKYWDGNLLLGTRKKKGQLMMGIFTRSSASQHLKTKFQTKQEYNFIEQKVELPLGTSSRYLFKVSQTAKNMEETKNEKLLTVINYKGIKMAIMVFKLSIKQSDEVSQSKMSRGEGDKKEQIKTQARVDGREMEQVIRSGQFVVESVGSVNSGSFFIEHIVMSQEEQQFLIAIYNNQLQTIVVIDFQQLIVSAVQSIVNHKSACFEKKQKLPNDLRQNQQSQEHEMPRQSPKRPLSSLYEHFADNAGQLFSDLPKETFKQDLFIKSQKSIEEPLQKNQQEKLHSDHGTMIIHQFSGLNYKVESLAFHKRNSPAEDINTLLKGENHSILASNTSYMIILGKDQSVRLLELYPFVQSSLQLASLNQLAAIYEPSKKCKNHFKYHCKALEIKLS